MLKIKWGPERIYGLDILRAIAILMVVISHGRFLLPKTFHSWHKYIVVDGVSIFFVLSGFLIGGILIKIIEDQTPQKNKLLNFWIRRWFRTLPNYFLILTFLIVLHEFLHPKFSVMDVKSYYYFSQNLFHRHPPFFGEAWSLSVEEWFYLIVPILIFGLIKLVSPNKSVLIVCAAIIVFCTLLRYYRFSMEEINVARDWGQLLRKQVVTRLDSIMLGVIGAYIQYYFPKFWNKHTVLYLGIGLLIFVLGKTFRIYGMVNHLGFYSCTFSLLEVPLATLFLLPFLSNFQNGSGKIYKAITYISLISYSMYLVHNTLIKNTILKIMNLNSLINDENISIGINYFLYYFLTIILSILLYKYWEMPMMKLRDSNFVKRLLGR